MVRDGVEILSISSRRQSDHTDVHDPTTQRDVEGEKTPSHKVLIDTGLTLGVVCRKEGAAQHEQGLGWRRNPVDEFTAQSDCTNRSQPEDPTRRQGREQRQVTMS